MERAEAVDLLRRLHQAQQAFYAGGDEASANSLVSMLKRGEKGP